jgi:hypothetical protein
VKWRRIAQAVVTPPGMDKIHTKTVGDLLRVPLKRSTEV